MKTLTRKRVGQTDKVLKLSVYIRILHRHINVMSFLCCRQRLVPIMSEGRYSKTEAENSTPGKSQESYNISTEKRGTNPFTYEKQVDLNDERVRDRKTNTEDLIGLHESGVDVGVNGEDDRRFVDTSSQHDGEEQVDIGLKVTVY